MKLIDSIKEEQLQELINKHGSSVKRNSNIKKNNPKSNDALNERDIVELMGIDRDTYKRVRGRIRNNR